MNDSNQPTPIARPKINISDITLIKNSLQIVYSQMIPELQDRIDVIIKELARAEILAKGDENGKFKN